MTVRGYMQIAGCIGMFILWVKLGKKSVEKEFWKKSYASVCKSAKEMERGFFSYTRWERYLRTHGAGYHFWKGIGPLSYLTLSLLVGTAIGIVAMRGGAITGVAGILFGLFLPGMYLEYANRKDNDEMLTELDMIYSALAIQIRAGVSAVDALAECYVNVRGIRLREALRTLSGDIVMKSDLRYSLRRLQGEFDNRYIDSLCITLLQAAESGQGATLLGDISDQIKDMQLILQEKKKEKLGRSVTFYQLGVFALVLVITLYACVTHLFEASIFFV